METRIALNDFVSFDNFLFGDKRRDWSTFLNCDDDFISPIAVPTDIIQNQLCHYAYWMTIAKNNLREKPWIISADHIYYSCYACYYATAMTRGAFLSICEMCPLKKERFAPQCGNEYRRFKNALSDEERSEWAEKVAKIIWKEPKFTS